MFDAAVRAPACPDAERCWQGPFGNVRKAIEGLRAVWTRAKVAAGLPAETRLHDLRHTFASMCINGDVPLYNVSKLLGHSSQATTTRYAHFRDDRLLEAANAVGAIASGTARRP